MNLINIFKQLGLQEEHLKVYLANLELGETIITNIARKSKIPRTTIYLLIKDLLPLGLVTQSMKQGKTNYIPARPEYIQDLLARKQVELQQSILELNNIMTDLKAIQNTNPKKPKVEYLEGAEGIMQAYNRTFEAKEIWIQCLTKDYESVISSKFFNEYFDKFFFKSNIKSRELLRSADEEYIKKYGSEKNLQRKMPVLDDTETDFWVYDEKVTFISFNKEKPYALVIEDKDIATAMKNMYDLAWKQATK